MIYNNVIMENSSHYHKYVFILVDNSQISDNVSVQKAMHIQQGNYNSKGPS